jgi:hypothetical protein
MKTNPSERPSIVEVILALKKIQNICVPSKDENSLEESEDARLSILLRKIIEDLLEKKFGSVSEDYFLDMRDEVKKVQEIVLSSSGY